MAEIKDSDDLRAWLGDKPSDFARVIAGRAGLRILPLVKFGDGRLGLTVSVFRALLVAWAAVRWPAYNLTDAARAAARATLTAALDATGSVALAARAAAYAADAARTTARSAVAAAYSVDAAAEAVYSLKIAEPAKASEAAEAVWQNLTADTVFIENASDPSSLLRQPLWPRAGIAAISFGWDALKREMIAQDEAWTIWIEWYERCLEGEALGWNVDPEKHEALCVGIALESNKFWERPAGEVNADIAARVEAARLPPPQDTHVAHFELDNAQHIVQAELSDDDRLGDRPPQRDHYLEFVKSFRVLGGSSGNELGETLRAQVEELGEVLTDEIAELNRHLFWPRFARLRKCLRRHERAMASQDYSPHRLDMDAADDLREVVENGNILIIHQPLLMQTEDESGGPRRAEDVPLPKPVSDVIMETAADPDITDPAAGKDAVIAVEAASDTADSADLAAARHGRRVASNFVIMLVERARKVAGFVAKKAGDVATGEAVKAFIKLMVDNRETIGNFITSVAPEIGKWVAQALGGLGGFL